MVYVAIWGYINKYSPLGCIHNQNRNLLYKARATRSSRKIFEVKIPGDNRVCNRVTILDEEVAEWKETATGSHECWHAHRPLEPFTLK